MEFFFVICASILLFSLYLYYNIMTCTTGTRGNLHFVATFVRIWNLNSYDFHVVLVVVVLHASLNFPHSPRLSRLLCYDYGGYDFTLRIRFRIDVRRRWWLCRCALGKRQDAVTLRLWLSFWRHPNQNIVEFELLLPCVPNALSEICEISASQLRSAFRRGTRELAQSFVSFSLLSLHSENNFGIEGKVWV